MSQVTGERTAEDPPGAPVDGDAQAAEVEETGPTASSLLADRALLAAVVVGAALRLWGFAAQSLWYDEWLTAEAASGSLGHLRRYVTEQAGIPPTYFAIMWTWARVFGTSDAALRFPSVLVGVALVPVAYGALLELGQRRAAARVAALLVAVNPMLIWYSQEARPYSLLALLGALSLWLLARLARSTRTAETARTGFLRDLAAWAFVAALAIAVHYVAVFLIAAEAVVVLRVLVRRRPGPRDVLVGSLPAVVVLAALAPFGAKQFSQRDNHAWILQFPLRDRLDDAARGALLGPSPPSDRLWILGAAAAVAAVGLLVVRGDRSERRGALVVGAFGLGPVALALLGAAVGVDMIVARYLIVSLAAVLAAAAIGLTVSGVPRAVGAALVGLITVVSVVTVVADARDPALQRANWRAVAEAHERAGLDGDPRDRERLLVVSLHGFLAQPLHEYLDGERVLGAGESVTVEQIDVVVAKSTTEPCNLLVGLACALIFLGPPPPEPLASRLTLVDEIDLDQFVVQRFVADEPVTVSPADVVPAPDLADSLVLVTR
jgi:hypothetical protein